MPERKIDADGELLEPFPFEKRKSKGGFRWLRLRRLLLICIIALLFLVGIGSGIWLGRQTGSSSSPTSAKDLTITPAASISTILPSPITGQNAPGISRNLIVGTTDGDILTNIDGTGFKPLAVKGHDVVSTADGKSLAYVRDDLRLIIYRDGKEYPLNSFGNHKLPFWGPDGKSLAFVSNGSDGHGHQGDFVYWLKIDNNFKRQSALYLGYTTQIGSPPLADPQTGQLLVVANQSLTQTEFLTVDPLCGCSDAQRSFTTVDYRVNWATYDPTGSFIIFSEDKGNLYQLDVITKQIAPFIVDKVKKHRPTFSPDGKQIAYFDDDNTVYIYTLANKEVTTIPFNVSVESLSWNGNTSN
jgi:hypothetical protein